MIRVSDYSRLQNTSFPQARMRSLKAAVVGAGALGSEVIKTLCLLGTGQITVVDPDIVEASNLCRSILFRDPACLGCPKAEVIARVAERSFPDTQVIPLCREVADAGTTALSACPIWFGCVHSELARVEISYLATQLAASVADGALGDAQSARGSVSWFPSSGACYCCILGGTRRRELLSELDVSVAPCGQRTLEGTIASTPTMASIIGGLQVEVGLRSFFDAVGESFTADLRVSGGLRLNILRRARSEDCPFHWACAGRRVPLSESRVPVGLFLATQVGSGEEDPVVVLDWPVCVRAACRDCGHVWSPMMRIGRFRRTGVCPSCGGRGILELQSLRAIERESDWAVLPFSAFGVPDATMVTIRDRKQAR